MSNMTGDPGTSKKQKSAKVNFQSKELEEILNIIDNLRSQGISRYIDLPQLIVCGDQSSGKSSVLEAVSGLRFPTKDNLCTRFATELVLRRSPSTSSDVTIIPDPGRPDEEKIQLQKFKPDVDIMEQFGSVVEAAGAAMGLDNNSKVFSNDILRVELTGPSLPHLTLVDLPGLFHAGNRNQSEADADTVKTLVTGYMSKSRSVILAVVSAKNDYANQIVTKYARAVDPQGERTMGIITKPDTLDAGSASEQQFFELAENKDVVLRLGWHVLKNRGFDTKDCSGQERNEAEAKFLSQGIWAHLKPTQLGIHALTPRLSKVLRDQILNELPSLIRDVESGLKDCEARVTQLGPSRGTQQQQRLHLHRISQQFCYLVKAGVDGIYNNEFFEDDGTKSVSRTRIRAIVSNLLIEFESEMRLHGHKYEIVDHSVENKQQRYPIKIQKDKRIDQVIQLIKKNRGLELPGFPKHENITMLFRDHSMPWAGLVRKYAGAIYDAVRVALLAALDKAADASTRNGILRYLIDPALDELSKDLDMRIQTNLQQHLYGHPITFNHYFTDNVQKIRAAHEQAQLHDKILKHFNITRAEASMPMQRHVMADALAETLASRNEADMTRFASSEALHFMEAYYKVAIKFFIDDFSIHTIEEGLMQKLLAIFEPNKTLELENELVEDIAGETEDTQLERVSLTQKLAVLTEALKVLQRLDRGQPKNRNVIVQQTA